MGGHLKANMMCYHTLGQFFELLYMKLPQGVLKPGEEGKVCCLVKGLYGLKQAGHGWYQEMSEVLIKDLGFTCSTVDHSVFFWHSPDEHTIIVVATDNMAVTLKWAEDIIRFKAEIQHYWEITDNGPIQWFLGFQILCNCTMWTISINQSTDMPRAQLRLLNACKC